MRGFPSLAPVARLGLCNASRTVTLRARLSKHKGHERRLQRRQCVRLRNCGRKPPRDSTQCAMRSSVLQQREERCV
jgi:hypothetical protein